MFSRFWLVSEQINERRLSTPWPSALDLGYLTDVFGPRALGGHDLVEIGVAAPRPQRGARRFYAAQAQPRDR